MHWLITKLRRDHDNLEKVLSVLKVQVDVFCDGHESNTDLLIELMEYLESYADHRHHPLEEVIFKVGLAARPELNTLLSAQHRGVSQMTKRFRQSLEGVMQGGVMLRDEIGEQGREYIALQSQHLDLEEREVFTFLDENMTEADWEQVEASLSTHADPVFDAPDKVRFYNLLSYLEETGDNGG